MSKWLLLLMIPMAAPVNAVPPPAIQSTADCLAPAYASDFLVCEDPGLHALDALLASHMVESRNAESDPDATADDQDWFRRSRLCAFEPDHRECLMTAYCLRLALIAGAGTLDGTECVVGEGDYTAASAISKSGFVRKEAKPDSDRPMLLSGFVDYSNLFGDENARKILADWWGGYGPDASTWQFNLRANKTDPAGRSFPVLVPNDMLRDDLLRIFLRDAREGIPTRVCLKGGISTFDAPMNASTLQGLSMQLHSTRDIRLGCRTSD